MDKTSLWAWLKEHKPNYIGKDIKLENGIVWMLSNHHSWVHCGKFK